MKSLIGELFSGLYGPEIVDNISTIAEHYLTEKRDNPNYKPVPSSLHGATSARDMSDPVVKAPDKPLSDLFKKMGVYDGERIKGPLNHILARLLTIPRMIEGYIENYPTGEEKAIYKDPPMLQLSPDELKRIRDDYFTLACEKLKDRLELANKFRIIGLAGETVADIESAYPGESSTEAYENFGIFHLFPSNETVDITSTSPGVIIPTEADPLRYKDTVEILKKNLLRPTYFEMLRLSIELAKDRVRRYSANRGGTAENLAKYISMLGAAKQILSEYLELGERFEIRLGEQDPRMKLATLIGDIGVVYSVRDKEQKSKIAHNVTVIDPEEARRQREIFEEQWAKGERIDSVGIIDHLVKEYGNQ
jgi:hypothetical protein